MVKYVVTTRLTDKQIKAYMKGNTFTHKPEIEEDDRNDPYEVEVTSKKVANKLEKMHIKRKGVRLQHSDIADIRGHNGSGFLDSVKKALTSNTAKAIVGAVAPKLATMAAEKIGEVVKEKTGSDTAGLLAKEVTKVGAKEGLKSYQGSGLPSRGQFQKAYMFKTLPHNKIVLVNNSTPTGGAGVGGYKKGYGVGGYQRGGGLKSIEEHNRLVGWEQDQEPDYEPALASVHDRMARVRSFRKSTKM
jgi:hypothetical protein